METIEGNRLIAEFMGYSLRKIDGEMEWDYNPIDNPHGSYPTLRLPICGTSENNLRFHESWDWLMPVVEKIDSLLMDDKFVTVQMNRTLIEMPEHGLTIEGLGDSWIEAAYNAVVEFIQWYNKKQITYEN